MQPTPRPSRPRVLLDATSVPPDRGGVGRYVDGVLPELRDTGCDVVVVCQARDADHFRATVPGAAVLAAPTAVSRRPVRLLWEQVALPVLARRHRVHLVHSPHYTVPVASPVPVVATLHDATFFTHPEVHSSVKRTFFRAWTRVALRRARRCLVPSEATRAELVREAGALPARVDVAHLGVDARLFHESTAQERAAARVSLGLSPDEPYVAFLGTLEPRKNVPALVQAWTRACEGRTDPPALVLAGGAGWDPGVDAAVAAVPAGLRLLRPGYVPVEVLAGYLGGAEVVAYPSLGEGFGLPVLEAMACGAAVLTSAVLSLPEVGGDAVAYTGTSADEIAQALGELLDDPGRRAVLARAGVARAATFTWAACARRHRQTYDAALSTGAR